MLRSLRMIRAGWGSLARNRGRAAIMLLATSLGVTALVVIVAFGRATQQVVLDRFAEVFGGNAVFLRGGSASFTAGQSAVIPPTNLTIADLDAVQAAVRSVNGYDPMLNVRRNVSADGRSRDVPVEGHGAQAERLWGRPVTRGNFFSAEDIASAARVALVGEVLARELFGRRDPVGARIQIGSAPFQVIGVLAPGGLDPHGADRDDVVWIPISTMQRRVANADFIMLAKVGHAPGTDLDLATLEMADVLRARHQLAPGVVNDFSIFTPIAVQSRVRESGRAFTVLLPLATLFAILVGAFIVANLMLLTVSERRAEIGLRKAVGARSGDILIQILGESVLITGVGGVLAVAAGQGLLRLAPLWSMDPMAMPWDVTLLGVGVSLLVGAAAGLAPARRAARLEAVAALR
jgi:putative ABC transport system permease protein